MPYRELNRAEFDAVLKMLAMDLRQSRTRRAYLHHDRINHQIRGRRGARLAAITSGGAIPDTANYAVIAEPDGTVVGSVDEDFAVESLAGDIILLGNTSWRMGVETGNVRVEDAQARRRPFRSGAGRRRPGPPNCRRRSHRLKAGD